MHQVCRFTRELLFCALPLSGCLAFTLLSRQRLYPRATNLTFYLIVHVLVLGRLASDCGVMLEGFSQQHAREEKITTL